MEVGSQYKNPTTQETQEFIGKLTSKGEVTIPIEVRRILGVEPKEKVVFRVQGSDVTIESGPLSLEEVMGSVKPLQPHKDLKEIRDEAIEEHVEQVVAKMNR